MDKESKQLPQNLKALLQDIGENAVLFYLFTQMRNKKGWMAFKNLEEAGCDIVLLNLKDNRLVKIEVKTRQSMYTSAKKISNSKAFQLTKLEYNSLDFLVCYWLDHHDFFIFPKKAIPGKKKSIRIRIARRKDGTYGENNEQYRNNWQTLMDQL